MFFLSVSTSEKFLRFFSLLQNSFKVFRNIYPCKREELFHLLDMWVEQDVPIAIIGDVNENLEKNKKQPILNKMTSMGFEQQIKESTCQTGSLIDHLYLNNAMKAKNISTTVDAVYYSDHDMVSLYIPKPE